MTLGPRVPLLLGGVLVTLVGCTPRVPATRVGARGELGRIRRFDYSSSPETRAMVRQLDNGPRDLARQLMAARREGIPLTPHELQAPSPPAAHNAAPLYAQLSRFLKAKPMPDADKLVTRLDSRFQHTPEETRRVRRMLLDRRDVMSLIHQAADRPRCVFRRDWSLGMRLTFPELAAMREAARLLKAESYLLAQEGRYQQAIVNQTRGFRIAEHAASNPSALDYLSGLACHATTLAGMEDILHQCGPDVRVADQVRASLAAHHIRSSLRHAWEGEVVMSAATRDWFRQIGPDAAERWLSSEDAPEDRSAGGSPGASGQEPVIEKQFGLNKLWEAFGEAHPGVAPAARKRLIWTEFLDASEAAYLVEMRRMTVATEKPRPERAALYQQVIASGRSIAAQPVQLLFIPFLPVFVKAEVHRLRSQGGEEVVMAGAAVLAYKARHGHFPARFGEALPRPPLDPYGDQPLQYRREGDGFVAYSAGPEGRFDGGRPGSWTDRAQACFRYPAPPPLPPRS